MSTRLHTHLSDDTFLTTSATRRGVSSGPSSSQIKRHDGFQRNTAGHIERAIDIDRLGFENQSPRNIGQYGKCMGSISPRVSNSPLNALFAKRSLLINRSLVANVSLVFQSTWRSILKIEKSLAAGV